MGAAEGLPRLPSGERFETRLDIHDRMQLELKLEYQPSGGAQRSEYLVETLLFIPKSLNIGPETWPREAFYGDLHNYVRLSTPELTFEELSQNALSPLRQLEGHLSASPVDQQEVVHDAKMLACVLRAALRRFVNAVSKVASHEPATAPQQLTTLVPAHVAATREVLARFRAAYGKLEQRGLEEKPRAALRLVDEYLSLLVEQYLRRAVVEMDRLPRTPDLATLRRELMDLVVSDESYRRERALPSVLNLSTTNEEYAHRLSFLKKFCQNILFLAVERSSPRKKWEEVLFALAAGSAMAFALAVGLFAQSRYPQASFNFFVIAVVGYMLKDRIKEGLRRLVSSYLGRITYERSTRIVDPVKGEDVGLCQEKLDYGEAVEVPAEVARLRAADDLITAAQGELAESVLRYRKKIILHSRMLPKLGDGLVTGVTDIIRLNVDRLLHDMDDPEYALDYVDLEDFTLNKVTLCRSYRVDLAVRLSVDDGKERAHSVRVVRLVLDRNGIKRMTEVAAA